MLPKVSVILPNYNHGRFLRKRIETILAQTYTDFELIILDDASTDNSKEVIESFRGNPKLASIIYNEQNSGSTFIQWEKGINAAAGELIWIAESDDYCEPGFLSELAPRFDADPSLVIAYCQSLFVTPEGAIINRTEAPLLAQTISGQDFLSKYLLKTNFVANVSMALLKRSALKSVSGLYKSFTYTGDWLLYSDLALKGNVFSSGKYLNYYLRHPNTVTSKATTQGLDILEGNRVFNFIMESVPVTPEDLNAALNYKIQRFVELRGVMAPEIQQKVIESLHSLSPSMKKMLAKRLTTIRVRAYIRKALNMLPFTQTKN